MDRRPWNKAKATILLSAVMVAVPPVLGASPPQPSLGAEWKPIDPARLDAMRGGFQLPSGLMLSFGIERAVYVNGELIASISFHVADPSRITAGEAHALAEFNRGIVVQLGGGNRFDPANLLGGVVIQNTLDNQDIQTITRLDVGSNTLGAFQDLNASGALQDALLGAAGTP